MNKLLTKIVGLSLGLSMAIGVGVAVAANQKGAVPVQADSSTQSGSIDLSSASTNTGDDAWDMSGASGYYSNNNGAKLDATGEYVFRNSIFSGTVSNNMTALSVTVNGKINGTSTAANSYKVEALDSSGNALTNDTKTGASEVGTSFADLTFSMSSNLSGCTGIKVIYANKGGGNWGVKGVSWTATYTAASNTYAISTTGLVNGTATGATTIDENSSATVTLVPNTGYKLPANSSSITVTNATLTSYDSSNGNLVISNPTDDVSISATFPVATSYTVSASLTNLTKSGDTSIYENGTATVTLAVSDSSVYALPTALTSVTNAVSYNYNSSTGVVTINGATGNVVITASAINKPAEAYEDFSFPASGAGWTEVTAHGEYTKTVDLITVKWEKDTGNDISYWNPARIYNHHIFTFTATTGAGAVTTIKSITITANSNTYATNTASSNVTKTVVTGGGSIASSTADGSTVTITMTGTVTKLTLVCGSTQVRWNSLRVTYEKDQSEVALQSISATCDGVLVSQQVTPAITYKPAGATDKVVTYAVTSGSQYATVDASTGVITGIGAGTATITITPHDTHASATTVDVVVTALPSISTVEVGKKYAVVASLSSINFELTGINSSGSYPYGTGTTYETDPSESFPVRVVNGLYAHTVALEVEIESSTMYLSYDKNDANNNLTAVASIDRTACWIFAEESSALVVRNVDVYGRKLGATVTTISEVKYGRFACYQNLSETIITPTFQEIVEAKTDKEYVQDFVDLYMHMNDYNENKGWCNDLEHSYYLTAKTGYNSLIYGQSARENLFQNDSDFTAAKARYERWAEFNNNDDPYDGKDEIAESKVVSLFDSTESSTVITVISIISVISVSAIGGFFFLRKRKEQ